MGIALRSMHLAGHTLVEEVIEKEGFQFRVLFIRRSDIAKENTLHARQLIELWCVMH